VPGTFTYEETKMVLTGQVATRREVVTSVLGALVMSASFGGCGGEDPSKANPEPENKRAKYRDIHPPEPGKKPAKKSGGVKRP